jgi:hypothetical protein
LCEKAENVDSRNRGVPEKKEAPARVDTAAAWEICTKRVASCELRARNEAPPKGGALKLLSAYMNTTQ